MDVDEEDGEREFVGKNDETGESIDANKFMGVPTGWLNEKEKQARIGFMRMNVVSPPAGTKWGHFNNRIYRPDWIKNLVQQYPYKLLNCTDGTAMTATVRRSWVENLDEVVESVHNGGHIDRIPLLKLTAEGEKAAKAEGLWMFSGNHRREALEMYLGEEKAKLAVMDAKIAKSREKQLEKGASFEVNAKEMAIEEEAEELRAMIEKNSHWSVRIYDRGECRSGREAVGKGHG
jgi:hypothetical protein